MELFFHNYPQLILLKKSKLKLIFLKKNKVPLIIHKNRSSPPRWWLLVDHCVMRNWDRILVRAVKGLISRAGIVSICSLLWQRDVKLQQSQIWKTKPSYFGFKPKHFWSDCFRIWHEHRYGWEDTSSWKARQAQSDYWRSPQGPPNSPIYTFKKEFGQYMKNWFQIVSPCSTYVSTVMRSAFADISVPWYPWILCKGPTWPLNFFFNIFSNFVF